MKLTDYIIKDIKPFLLKNTIAIAQDVFKSNSMSHFHVVENMKLLGSFAEKDIQFIENNKETLTAHKYLLDTFFVDEKATVLSLLKVFADNDTTVVPVLNEAKNYIGYYDLRDVLDFFATTPFINEISETVVIEKLSVDYSMGEISQIIETNGSELLGMYISSKKDAIVQVTLKIVSEDINETIQTLRRYDYKIVSMHENDRYLEDLKNRSDYLQKYLTM